MTTPNGHQPPMVQPPISVTVNVSAQVVPGPDGTPWVSLDLSEGYTRSSLAMPARDCMALAEMVTSILMQAAAQAGHQPAVVAAANGTRRTPSGLVLP